MLSLCLPFRQRANISWESQKRHLKYTYNVHSPLGLIKKVGLIIQKPWIQPFDGGGFICVGVAVVLVTGFERWHLLPSFSAQITSIINTFRLAYIAFCCKLYLALCKKRLMCVRLILLFCWRIICFIYLFFKFFCICIGS